MILLVSASQVARITGVSYQHLACSLPFNDSSQIWGTMQGARDSAGGTWGGGEALDWGPLEPCTVFKTEQQ
jgi:hypothetical protein